MSLIYTIGIQIPEDKQIEFCMKFDVRQYAGYFRLIQTDGSLFLVKVLGYPNIHGHLCLTQSDVQEDIEGVRNYLLINSLIQFFGQQLEVKCYIFNEKNI